MESPERLSLQSADGAQLNLDALYQIAPSCFTEAADPKTGKIKRMVNFDTLRQLLGDDAVEDAPEAYEFNWVGKQAARAEVLRPINKTLRPVKEDSVDWDNTQNLYIEGDNLEVLKLLQKSYLGKVKMIYIDPPYNTGNDFVYHDDFARTQAEENLAAGNVDELGNIYRKNTDSNGRYHSDWCSMIYSRLMIARSLLKEDGVIFISIDENEIRNLRNVCDEVFGAANHVGTFIWRKKNGGGQAKEYFVIEHEYVVVYRKSDKFIWNDKIVQREQSEYNKEDNGGKFKITKLAKWGNTARREDRPSMYFPITAPDGIDVYPIAPDGGDGRWRVGAPRMSEIISNKLIYWDKKNDTWVPYEKEYYEGQSKIIKERSILYSVANTGDGSNELTELFGRKDTFENPKPTSLLKTFLEPTLQSGDIALDFFSGSATTAHAVMQLNAEDGGNRKFIMVQLPEETPEDSEAYKAGYKNICEIGKERIRRAGKKIKEESPLTTQDLDTGFRVFRMDSSNYEEVEHAPKDWNQDQLDLFLDNIKSDRTDLDLLFGCMLDWGVQLSLPMTTEEVDGKKIYTVNEGDLVACFAEKVTDNVVRAMAEKQPLRVIFRDSCFERDADKINIYETFKQLLDWSDQEVVKNIRVI